MWAAGDYAPLPSLVQAARSLFRREPLPRVRRAHSTGVNEAVEYLVHISTAAARVGGRHLALITGVPGAGKTLTGLQFVYHPKLDSGPGRRQALFLSGNGPLVRVLQHILKTSVFVQDVHGFLKTYGGGAAKRPEERILVYDEAQRAWDAQQASKKRPAFSEPQDFLSIGLLQSNWSVMVALIGEGQEIYVGEEAGVRQWDDAIRSVGGRWQVHCPERLRPAFPSAAAVDICPQLDLSESLRSHLAGDVHRWAAAVLDARFDDAAAFAHSAHHAGFPIYLTRDLEAAKRYAVRRYVGEPEKRFGLVTSVYARDWETIGNTHFQARQRVSIGPWFDDGPESEHSGCRLTQAVTEMECQGLELDLPIVLWGEDLRWNERAWNVRMLPKAAQDARQLRLNCYRVLLTRGRDGLVIVLPRGVENDPTASVLKQAGARPL